MSTVRKSKLDLLLRVRYANPLPPPPCPPKLLNVPTAPTRYARPEFLESLARETALPMIVDAELGMPLDLSVYDSFWDEGVDDRDINPSAEDLPELDPEDADLCADFSAPSHGQGTSARLLSAPWLRKTEYITSTRESSTRPTTNDPKHARLPPIDISRKAQLDSIEASFAAALDESTVRTLQHPNKPGVTVVESFPVLPDQDVWANSYDLYRFTERPAGGEDACLDCAILRPIQIDGEHFLAYYLIEDEETAVEFKSRREALPAYVPDDHETLFQYVRDYETTLIEQNVANEFVLVVDESGDGRPPAAYYKNVERKMTLRKRRANNAMDESQDKWDRLRLVYSELTDEERAEMNEFSAEVADPNWLWRLKEAQEQLDV